MFGNKVPHLPRVLEALHTTKDFFPLLKPFHVKEKSPGTQSLKLKNNPFRLLQAPPRKSVGCEAPVFCRKQPPVVQDLSI